MDATGAPCRKSVIISCETPRPATATVWPATPFATFASARHDRQTPQNHPPPDAPAAPAQADAPLHAPTHNIWLAGLGALASAQANAQAEGAKAFESLVQQGLAMQARTQALAKEQWTEATQRMGSLTAEASAVGSWDRLGGIFEGRVARALASMGMPTAPEIVALTRRVEALEQALAERASADAAAPAPAPASASASAAARRKPRSPR